MGNLVEAGILCAKHQQRFCSYTFVTMMWMFFVAAASCCSQSLLQKLTNSSLIWEIEAPKLANSPMCW